MINWLIDEKKKSFLEIKFHSNDIACNLNKKTWIQFKNWIKMQIIGEVIENLFLNMV